MNRNGFKRVFASIFILFVLLCNATVSTKAQTHPPLIVDDAGILTQQETADLEEGLNQISDTYDLDVVIYTEDNTSISSAMEAADDYFDYSGYGRRTDRSGILLYINMGTRDWWISTRGYAIYAFTDYGIEQIGNSFVSYLSEGEYAQGFQKFIDLCDAYLEQAATDEPYDVNNQDKGEFPVIGSLGISLVIGAVLAGIIIWILIGQLKSVNGDNRAANYVVNGSMHITESKERFLYKNVTKTKRETESSSSGGSSTHTSSSGASHGGGGGKF